MTIVDRPEGLLIALIFIALIIVISVVSRITRSTELRVQRVEFDESADELLDRAAREPQPVRFIANRLDAGDDNEYREKSMEVKLDNHLRDGDNALFLEVAIDDASDFATTVTVTAACVAGHDVLRATGSSVPNVLAAVLLAVRDRMPEPPHVYFEWSEKGPGRNALRFLFAGEGDVPPLTHEVLRRAEPDAAARPVVHAGG